MACSFKYASPLNDLSVPINKDTSDVLQHICIRCMLDASTSAGMLLQRLEWQHQTEHMRVLHEPITFTRPILHQDCSVL